MPISDHNSQLPNSSQQDDDGQDFEKLLCSLPREKGMRTSYVYKYQGFWHEAWILRSVLACQQHFEAHDTDIFLVTYPKCGTTWLKALMFTLMNRLQYPLNQQHPLLTKNPHELVPYLEIDLYVDNKIPDFSSFSSPRLLSTHLPIISLPKSVHDSKCKLVYLCRNLKDTFTSVWHFINSARLDQSKDLASISLEETLDIFCRGVNTYGPFWDHVLDGWKESCQKPDKVLFLKYEEMKEQPILQLRRLAEFLEFPFSAEEEASGVMEEMIRLCSFDNLKNLEVNNSGKLANGWDNKVLFRRGVIGDWKNLLSAEMVGQLDRVIEQKFQGSGLRL